MKFQIFKLDLENTEEPEIKSEKAMTPHSSTLAWKIPWAEEPGRSDTTEQLHFHVSLSCIREGNGNPFQCSCLENPRDGGAWWASDYGVAQSRTQLKRLSSSSRSNRDQIANICWIINIAREFQKNIYFCFIDYVKAFDCGSQHTVENSSRDGNYRTTLPAS